MKRSRMTIAAVAGAMLVLAAVLVVLYALDRSGHTPPVLLPTPSAVLSPTPSGPGDVIPIEVNAGNVQAVVASLSRAGAYSRTVTVEHSWQGGRANYNVSVSVRDGCTRASVSRIGSASIKTVVVTPEKYFTWNNSEGEYYEGPLGGAGADELADIYQMIPTYEDMLKLDKSRITEAGLTTEMGELRIYIRAVSPNFGYTEIYSISVRSGLLMSAQTFDGEERIYSMSSSVIAGETPEESLFRLPDGRNALDID